jgi:hypothetical protein
MPHTQTGVNSRVQPSQIINLPVRSAYSHTSLAFAEFFNVDASVQDSQPDTDCDSDMLTDAGISSG